MFAVYNKYLASFDQKIYDDKFNSIRKFIQNNIKGAVSIVDVVKGGSDIRKSAIPGVSDMDILMVIGTKKPSALPLVALKSIDSGINTAIMNTKLSSYVGTHAIYFPFNNTSIDLLVAYGKSPGPYYIPNRDINNWIKTDPKSIKGKFFASQTQSRERLLPTIRLVKKWNSYQNIKLESYETEMKLLNIFENDDTLKTMKIFDIIEVVSNRLDFKKLYDISSRANRYVSQGKMKTLEGKIKIWKEAFGDTFGKQQ
ncbi:MAG: hypothetical protein HeimC2_00420 [Candidatus Heimdallarchaeota archaeon LC_2]|nr:MAG: hypothetical protein HeimC2_00420 [Candidatus Heimdallarchaeota archaeon LC_2]